MNQGAFLMRRLENVRGEFSLTALAYNIKRAISENASMANEATSKASTVRKTAPSRKAGLGA
jgi:hypothetical protein